jgi:hypothetical protein
MFTSMPSTTVPLLATAAVLRFRATGRDKSGSTLGVLVDASGTQQHLVIADGDFALSSALTAGQTSVLIYESAASVLRGGGLNADRSISYQGDSYRIEPLFDGKAWTAKLSASS